MEESGEVMTWKVIIGLVKKNRTDENEAAAPSYE